MQNDKPKTGRRNRRTWRAAAALAALTVLAQPAAGNCPFVPWTSYKGVDVYRTPDEKAYLWVTARTSIDADGAPRAYHPEDVGRPCGRSGAGLDCPANAGYPSTTWWPTVLAPDPANPRRAFVQTDGPGAGFFVSKTSLADPRRSERDPARYVDAATVPFIVFPRPFYALAGTGKLGDIGIARHLGNGKQTPFVVADIGPDEPLGEASIALFRALGGESPNPRTGSGVASGPTLYLMFPYSVGERSRPWPVAEAERAAEADRLLAAIGGEAVLAACVARFE